MSISVVAVAAGSIVSSQPKTLPLLAVRYGSVFRRLTLWELSPNFALCCCKRTEGMKERQGENSTRDRSFDASRKAAAVVVVNRERRKE